VLNARRILSDISLCGVNLGVDKHAIEIKVNQVRVNLELWSSCHSHVKVDFVIANSTDWEHKSSGSLLSKHLIEFDDNAVNGLLDLGDQHFNYLVNDILR